MHASLWGVFAALSVRAALTPPADTPREHRLLPSAGVGQSRLPLCLLERAKLSALPIGADSSRLLHPLGRSEPSACLNGSSRFAVFGTAEGYK
uniref:Putative secreted protein n=1 Tax=Ixodes scapularis TaxID=6945 RepID=A0A4D5RYW2_IXOSC